MYAILLSSRYFTFSGQQSKYFQSGESKRSSHGQDNYYSEIKSVFTTSKTTKIFKNECSILHLYIQSVLHQMVISKDYYFCVKH